MKIKLLTSAIKGKEREKILKELKNGKIDFLVGTHAILEDTVDFKNLQFCVIDEQHRFGVNQREKLIKKGSPHILQMTATPIPRTLAMIAFGDQNLSVLTETPPGRKKIITKVVSPSDRKEIEKFVSIEIEKGRQVFVICPLVQESKKLEVTSVQEEFSKLKKIFPKFKIEVLHGKMLSNEKNEIMERFKKNDFDILVSTSVVEVGVDVPNATIILIEGAERFGLAQLHQFRGRVGRNKLQSYCFLFPTKNITPRLYAMEKENCGFKLAEIDLKIRGSGEIFGTQQSGFSDFKMINFSDGRIIAASQKSAEKFFEKNSDLKKFPEILKKIEKMENATQI